MLIELSMLIIANMLNMKTSMFIALPCFTRLTCSTYFCNLESNPKQLFIMIHFLWKCNLLRADVARKSSIALKTNQSKVQTMTKCPNRAWSFTVINEVQSIYSKDLALAGNCHESDARPQETCAWNQSISGIFRHEKVAEIRAPIHEAND